MKTPFAPRLTPTRAQGLDTWAVIVAGAERCLVRDGMAGLTTRNVAAAAGVGVGTVYRYFPNVEAIAIAVIDRLVGADVAAVMPVLEAAPELPIDVWTRELVMALMDTHRREHTLRAVMFSNRTLISERWRQAEQATVDAVTAVLRAHPDTFALPALELKALMLVYAIEAAVDAAVLRPPADDEVAVAVLVAMIRAGLAGAPT
jgi:AcrR family transcriptional regulator